mmetsp:Transcript_12085/g.13859  ORF Transcript_12085/g.13859 Transcript_12085/m.13859 type:complete len:143 (-) Transcript_12085:44-472(-)
MIKNEGKNLTVDDVKNQNQKLLNSIAECDFDSYKQLCSVDMTCFEPESSGMLIEGIEFHKYYFDLYNGSSTKTKPSSFNRYNISMSNPHVRFLAGSSDVAVISYVRVDQLMDGENPITKTMSETRIWEMRDGKLVNVHFHKS